MSRSICWLSAWLFSVLSGSVYAQTSLQLEVTPPPLQIHETPNLQKVEEGFYRGGRPEKDADLQELKTRYGIKSIVNLQSSIFSEEKVDDESDWARANGVEFVNFEMHPFRRPSVRQLIQSQELLARMPRPLFLHCRHGSDRTGIVVAAYRIQNYGWSVDRAFDEMLEYGHNATFLRDWDKVLERFARQQNGGENVSWTLENLAHQVMYTGVAQAL